MGSASIELAIVAAVGVLAGMWLLVRGFAGYGQAVRITDTSTSRIATLAIGEVRVSGVVEAAELSLVSPLQSAPCVYYRASISQLGDEGDDTLFEEERSVGFRVRDPSGSVRVFPRGAQFDVPAAFDEKTDLWGEAPPGLQPRTGGAFGAVGEPSREAQIAALLTVRRPDPALAMDGGESVLIASAAGVPSRARTRAYREARIGLGDIVTILGQVLPFDQLSDPTSADVGGVSNPLASLQDPEIAADLAAAQARGELAATPEEAWGNAAIAGFGIGRPVSRPELDPEATQSPLASIEEAARIERTFDIEPDDLVLATAPGAPLLIAFGPPGEVAARHEQRFLLGLLGGILAIGSAVALAVVLDGLLG